MLNIFVDSSISAKYAKLFKAAFNGKYSVSFEIYLKISNGLVAGINKASESAKASLII